jgi:DNA-binding NtrC family response regulator
MLEPKGWTVVTAESAQQAVEIVRMSIEAPSVALLDRNIPDANGLAIGTKLRELSPTMGIIFTSLDLPTPGDEISFEENDFYFLGKPFLAAALIRLLDQIRREARRLSKGEGTSTLK